ncbi:MAG: hypothetical protein QP733_06975, partial [Dialister micraerophilus]
KKAENKPQEKSYEEIGKEAFRDNFIKVDDYGPRVNVTFQAVDGLTDGMTEEGIQINIYNFLERLEGKDYETIFFKVMFPTTSGDLSTMANVELEKEAVDSINFDKQNFEDVKDKAKTYDVRIK